ncbi:MAG: leucyl aminopeptidase [Anaerolineae bacterium]|nr:leucyl aminopeptidase [Anaerolineae bacterium]
MEINVRSGDIFTAEADTLLVFVPQEELSPFAKRVNEALGGWLEDLRANGDFSGKRGESQVLYPRGQMSFQRVILIGIGKREDFDAEAVRRVAAIALQRARQLKAQKVASMTIGTGSGHIALRVAVRAMIEGALLGLYRYTAQKSAPEELSDPEQLLLCVYDDADLTQTQQAAAEGRAYAEGTMLARDLVNMPPNFCTPTYLAEKAQEIGARHSQKVTVLERSQMEALKMGALLAVAQGSEAPPHFIIMEHEPSLAEAGKTLVLVGKGVTFDTGGYSLKPVDNMVGMKADMSGAAAVIAAMQIIGTLEVKRHVVGLVPAADNMVSGRAYRPEDVITASNGKTVEIISTDAEGRLLLADALVYASRYQPAAVVDIATLTGGMAVALGNTAGGVFYTDQKLKESLMSASDDSGERLWPMPIYPEYSKVIESETADIRNSGGSASRMGSAGIGAAFLKHFVDYPAWAHIDMAGVMHNSGDVPYAPGKGGSGYGARLLAQWVANWQD